MNYYDIVNIDIVRRDSIAVLWPALTSLAIENATFNKNIQNLNNGQG